MSSEICQSTRVSLFYTATTALPSSPEYNFEEPAWWPHYNGEPLQWCCEETTADGSCAGDLTRCWKSVGEEQHKWKVLFCSSTYSTHGEPTMVSKTREYHFILLHLLPFHLKNIVTKKKLPGSSEYVVVASPATVFELETKPKRGAFPLHRVFETKAFCDGQPRDARYRTLCDSLHAPSRRGSEPKSSNETKWKIANFYKHLHHFLHFQGGTMSVYQSILLSTEGIVLLLTRSLPGTVLDIGVHLILQERTSHSWKSCIVALLATTECELCFSRHIWNTCSYF